MTQTDIFIESRKILDNLTWPPCITVNMKHEFEFLGSVQVYIFDVYYYQCVICGHEHKIKVLGEG